MNCVTINSKRMIAFGSLGFLAMFGSLQTHAETILSEEEAQKAVFPEADSFQKKLIVLSKDQLVKIRSMAHSKNAGRVYKYSVVKKKNVVLGYTLVETVWGKRDQIELMVALDAKANVIEVQILAHAKSRGRAILTGGFLAQFRKKNVSDLIGSAKGIDVVSGATISSRATIDGVRRVLDRFAILGPVRADATLKEG